MRMRRKVGLGVAGGGQGVVDALLCERKRGLEVEVRGIGGLEMVHQRWRVVYDRKVWKDWVTAFMV